MPYRYLTLTAAAVVIAAVVSASAAVVITAARGERTVKTANYAVCSAGKALGETAYDTVATTVVRATVVNTTVVAASVVAATVVYIVVISATEVVIVVDLTASAATA